MEKFYRKSELGFALFWIVLYIILFGTAESLSESIGIVGSIAFPVALIIALLIVGFIWKNNLWNYYGLRSLKGISYGRYLYFIPFLVLISSNLWNGVAIHYSVLATILSVASMLCVGFIEELIFRGFLFKAIARKNVVVAIIVSSITFGLGHIVNLLTGADFGPTLLQVVYAIAIGYLFTVFFIKSHNLIPCIITHGVLDALSVFAIDGSIRNQIIYTAILAIVALAYAIYLHITVEETLDVETAGSAVPALPAE